MPRKKRNGKPIGKFRSKFEYFLAESLNKRNYNYEYETMELPYVLKKKYKPDFILENGIIIEAKGVLTPDDRRKLKAVREQHPELDIRIVFQRASNRLSKNSVTTYGQWADRENFKWADRDIPKKWMNE